MYKTLEFELKSTCPMMYHNGELANPNNPITKEMKKVSGKRKKTDEDFEALARLEFLGGLYLNEKKQVLLPGSLVEGTFVKAGKMNKDGKQFRAGIIVDDAILEYEGQKDPEKLYEDKRFIRQDMVIVNGNRILRTRPIFNEWSAKVKVHYNPLLLDEDQVKTCLDRAGSFTGLGDWRPKFGRFSSTNGNGK